MNFYALALFAYFAFWLGLHIKNDGKQYTITPLHLLISQIISYFLLIAGGFFHVWHWPQITVITITAISWGVMAGDKFKPVTNKYNAIAYIVAMVIIWWIYYKGGFWIFQTAEIVK